jgi:O-antigen/teichoic acid export membrane protein
MTDQRRRDMSSDISENGNGSEGLRQELADEIHRLNRFSTRGLLALALFLIVSILAWLGFTFLPAPETIASYLGKPPSARMISIALLLYTFSAIILSLSRMTAAVEHRSSFSHVGFLAAFYLFYYCGKSLDDNYWAVFGAGITILGVESYRIWTYCTEGISKCREDLEYVTRTGRPPPQE